MVDLRGLNIDQAMEVCERKREEAIEDHLVRQRELMLRNGASREETEAVLESWREAYAADKEEHLEGIRARLLGQSSEDVKIPGRLLH